MHGFHTILANINSDFYLVPFGIYVEVCGSENFDYDYRKTTIQ